MALAHYKTRDTLASQALKEIDYSYRYKKSRMTSWNKNEDMMSPDRIGPDGHLPYSSKSNDNRAEVPLFKMHGFVHTIRDR